MRSLTRGVMFTLIAAFSMSLALAGCSGGEKAGAGRASVDRSSAKATMETLARAFKARDGQAAAECLSPEYRESFGAMLTAMMDGITQAESLKQTVEAKFGKEFADKVLKGSPSDGLTKNGPLGDCLNDDGLIDWRKAKVTESGETATFQIEGKPTRETLRKIDDKWYMNAPEGLTPEKAKTESVQALKMMKAQCDAVADVEKQVQAGKIGKDDLEKAMDAAMTKAMTDAMKDSKPNG